MLFHVSIEADDPRRTAEVLASVMGGHAAPFPPVANGSWMALVEDGRGTMIEVYPRGTALVPGAAGARGLPSTPRRCNATHFAIGTSMDLDAVLAIAAAEHWPAAYFKRGGAFGVIEVWIDDCQMIEVLTPEMQREYLDAMTIDKWAAMLNERAFAKEMAQAA